MKAISTFAVAVSLLAGSAMLATPALAQKKKEAAAAPAGPKLTLSKEERATLVPLQTALGANDFATAATLLPAAQAAAKGADARYILAGLQLKIAINNKDEAAQAAAVEAMLASGKVAPQDQARLYSALGGLYTNLKQTDRAAAAIQKLGELDPNNPQPMLSLAEARAKENKPAEAISLIERAIAAQTASGQAVPEGWYRRALKFAYEGNLPAQTLKLSQALVTAHPTADNWRDVLAIYRRQAKLDKAADTDVLRFMRAAKVLKGDAEVLTLASNLNDAGLPGESKAVIDDAARSNLINANKDYFKALLGATSGRVAADRASLPGLETRAKAGANGKLALSTADAFFGYGDYAKAADLYRAALQKGGVDTNLANTRLGLALALAGQRPAAEAALKAVTGPRATLAQFMLTWLAQRT
jgi:hypothetical protein